MKAEQINQALVKKFQTEGNRLVFWHDPKGEFAAYLEAGLDGELQDVKVVTYEGSGGFSIKAMLENEDTESRYLIYSKGEEQNPETDWLLSVKLYSARFTADVLSIWREELGLAALSTKDHLAKRETFLRNQDRRGRLAKLLQEADGPTEIDQKMLAVTVGSSTEKPFDILMTLLHSYTKTAEFNLETPPPAMPSIQKWDLQDSFWQLVNREFGYDEVAPSLSELIRRLLITEFSSSTRSSDLSALQHHLLPAANRGNVVAFLSQWRDSSMRAGSYELCSAAISEEQNLTAHADALDLETLARSSTFWAIEKRVIRSLRDELSGDLTESEQEVAVSIIKDRLSNHWFTGSGADQSDKLAMKAAYEALLASLELLTVISQKLDLSFDGAEMVLQQYTTNLYRIDRLYRDFWRNATIVREQGWDLLKDVESKVNTVYLEGFINPFGLKWSKLLEEGFLESWKSETLSSQQDFFQNEIKPYVTQSDRRRAFVIISDAFRYEAAEELCSRLNEKYRVTAELDAMLGVLPSYTKLGMASLLPRQQMAYSPEGVLSVDGQEVSSTESRSKLLQQYDGIAFNANDVIQTKQSDLRKAIEGFQVVYIYHNIIDAIGDNAVSEKQTFQAVDECLVQLQNLALTCINKLNGSHVWITADHGFLFQESGLTETQKSKLKEKPVNPITEKKRYVIGPSLTKVSEAHHGYLSTTASAGGEMEFWVPKSANRFHFAGGARFVHGGAMPQEVVVPLLRVSQLRGKDKEASKAKKVGVQVLGTHHVITTPKYRFEVIQTEAVGERRKPLRLRAALYEEGREVSSVETASFDSQSSNLEERKQSIVVELMKMDFDRTKSYSFILRDADNDAEVGSISVKIDRSFEDDF